MARFCLIREEEMAGAGNHHEFRTGDSLCNQVGISWRNQPVGLAVNDQCGSHDLAEAAVRLPAEDSLPLRGIRLRSRKPWPANRQVFINPFPRSRRIVEQRTT